MADEGTKHIAAEQQKGRIADLQWSALSNSGSRWKSNNLKLSARTHHQMPTHMFNVVITGDDAVGKTTLLSMIQCASEKRHQLQQQICPSVPDEVKSAVPPESHLVRWLMPDLAAQESENEKRRRSLRVEMGWRAIGMDVDKLSTNHGNRSPGRRGDIWLSIRDPGINNVRRRLTSSFHRACDLQFLLHDLSRSETLMSLEGHWRQNTEYSPRAQRVIVGTKPDQPSDSADRAQQSLHADALLAKMGGHCQVILDGRDPRAEIQLQILTDVVDAVVMKLLLRDDRPIQVPVAVRSAGDLQSDALQARSAPTTQNDDHTPKPKVKERKERRPLRSHFSRPPECVLS